MRVLLMILLPVLLVSALAGCSGTPRSEPFNLVIYDKSGGFVGFDQRFVVRSDGFLILDDRRTKQRSEAAVPAAELARLRELVESAEFRQTQRQYLVDGADLITHTIDAATPARRHTVSTMDPAAAKPPQVVRDTIGELERLMELAKERGR